MIIIGVVHLLAGGCSLIGCCFMGPRMGRFPCFINFDNFISCKWAAFAFLHRNEQVQRWKTSEHPWSLGSTCWTWRIHPCLWLPRLQWRISGLSLQFNFASQPFPSQARISKEGDGGTIALAIVNTILGGSTGGISVLLLTKFKWIVKNFVRKSSCLY